MKNISFPSLLFFFLLIKPITIIHSQSIMDVEICMNAYFELLIENEEVLKTKKMDLCTQKTPIASWVNRRVESFVSMETTKNGIKTSQEYKIPELCFTDPDCLIEAALKLTKDIDDLWLPDIVELLIAGNRFEDAILVTETIMDENPKYRALSTIVYSLINEGQFNEAYHYIMKMHHESRDSHLKGLVKLCAFRSPPNQVEQFANKIINDYDRDQALVYVAIAYAMNGKADRAQEIAQNIQSNYSKREALDGIASRLAEQKEFLESLRIARKLESPYYRARALTKIAIELEKDGQKSTALSTINEARNDAKTIYPFIDQVSTLCIVAIAEATVGSRSDAKNDIAYAKQIADKIEHEGRKSFANEDVAIAYASINLVPSALGILSELTLDVKFRSGAYINVAKAAAKVGDTTSAQILLKDASQMLVEYDDVLRDNAIRAVAIEQCSIGDIQSAIETACHSKWDHERNKTLAQLICNLIQANKLDDLIKVASQINSDIDRTEIILTILRVFVDRKTNPDLIKNAIIAAHSSAAKIIRPIYRARALIEIAEIELDIGELQNVITSVSNTLITANKIDYAFAGLEGQAEVLAMVAHVQSSMRQEASFDSSLSHIAQIFEEMERQSYPANRRAKALIKVANNLEGRAIENPCKNK